LKHFLSGFFAGFSYTQVAFFFDLLKTRAQGSVNKTMSYRQEISTIYKNDGMIGFTRGYTGMLMRDSPGFGVYFCTFEFLKRLMNLPEREKKFNATRELHNLDHYWIGIYIALSKFVCGGTAGCITWFMCYPFDTVKSKM